MEHGQLCKFEEQTLFKVLMSFSSWMTGPNWPINGEIDIIEGVNSATVNGMTLHTDAGCSVSHSNSTHLGSLVTPRTSYQRGLSDRLYQLPDLWRWFQRHRWWCICYRMDQHFDLCLLLPPKCHSSRCHQRQSRSKWLGRASGDVFRRLRH